MVCKSLGGWNMKQGVKLLRACGEGKELIQKRMDDNYKQKNVKERKKNVSSKGQVVK